MEIEILSQSVKSSESEKHCKHRNTHFSVSKYLFWGLYSTGFNSNLKKTISFQNFTTGHTPSSRRSSLLHFSITCDHVKSKIKSTVTIFAILSVIIGLHVYSLHSYMNFVPAEENLVFNERSVKMIKGSINITVKMKLLTLEVACY